MTKLASWMPYLDGEEFSAGRRFKVENDAGNSVDRITLLAAACRDKSVLHVGCADHAPLIHEKIEADTWLHARLDRAAKRCTGIDINEDGIEEMRRLGWSDVVTADVTSSSVAAELGTFDVIVLGEVLEHIDDPIGFLSDIVAAWRGQTETLFVTVPNAFALSTLRAARRSTEVINTDHRFWFTPFTAAKVMRRAGLEIVNLTMADSKPPSSNASWALRAKRSLHDRLLGRNALLRSTIVLELRIPGELDDLGEPG